jgi:hypothetical protein
MNFQPNGLSTSSGSPAGSRGIPPATVSAAVNRTSDLGVRKNSCKKKGNSLMMNESSTDSLNRARTIKDTFQYKAITQLGFWNVRTLNKELAKPEQVEREMLRFNIGILCMSETKWKHDGEEVSSTGLTSTLSSKAVLNQENILIGGVGIMMTKEAKRSLISWDPISNRLMTARFRSNVRNITIINCYAPHEKKSEEEKILFYQQLNDAYDKSPRADIKIVVGDFNAQIGSENAGVEKVMGRHGVGSRNINGEMLIDFCVAQQLVIGGSLFPHKTCHKITWVSPDGRTQNQIDHFVIQQKWRKTLRDVHNRRGADIGSDHHLVIAELQLKTASVQRSQNNQIRTPRFHTAALKTPEIRHNFATGLNEKTSSFRPSGTINNMWVQIKQIYLQNGLEHVPLSSVQRTPWISQTSWDLIDRRRLLKGKLIREQNMAQRDILRTEYSEVHKLTKRSVRRDKRRKLNDLVEKAEVAASRNDTAELYKITKEISGGKDRAPQAVADESGRLLTTAHDQLQRWSDYFCKLLNEEFIEQQPPLSDDIQMRRSCRGINTEAPTLDEIIKATQSLKTDKAAGIDGIPAEFLKVDTNTTGNLLLPLFQKIWVEETFPTEWKEGVICKIPKKGNLLNCNNWRGLTLLSVFSKIMARIILNRIGERIDSTLKRHQVGFRSGGSCVDHINTLRIILEQYTGFNSEIHLMFVDFEKAFDRVNREYIWRSLTKRGIPEKIVSLIKASYNNSRCSVLHNGQLSNSFEVKQGVRQGCILSPILFLVVIDDILTAAVGDNEAKGIQWRLAEKLSHLDYADDVCLLANSRSGLRTMSHALYEKGKCAGLKINIPKTKIMSVNATEDSQQLLLQEQVIQEVQQFTYLGSELSPKGGAELDVEKRINKARTAFGKLSKIWQSNIFSLRTKLRLFNSNVKSVLLYGCETWKVTVSITKKLQTYTNRCLRRILKIRWPRIISNNELWQITGQTRIQNEIRRRKWRWIGHTLRKANTTIARQAFDFTPHGGSRRPGRPPKTWRSTVEDEARGKNKSWLELKHLARNRAQWKEFVDALCS